MQTLLRKYLSCDTTITVFSKLIKNSSSQAIASKSKWFVGSSSNKISGLPNRALANKTLTFKAPVKSFIAE